MILSVLIKSAIFSIPISSDLVIKLLMLWIRSIPSHSFYLSLSICRGREVVQWTSLHEVVVVVIVNMKIVWIICE